MKDVARTHDATVNDVLVTCLAGTLHAYLHDRDRTCASTTWMIPVNLKPLDLELPEGASVRTDENLAVASVVAPVVVEEPEPEVVD